MESSLARTSTAIRTWTRFTLALQNQRAARPSRREGEMSVSCGRRDAEPTYAASLPTSL